MLKIKVASCDKLQYFSFAPLQNFCYIGLNIEEGNITRINVSMRKIYYMENFERLGDIYIYILQGWNLYRKIWVVGKPVVGTR